MKIDIYDARDVNNMDIVAWVTLSDHEQAMAEKDAEIKENAALDDLDVSEKANHIDSLYLEIAEKTARIARLEDALNLTTLPKGELWNDIFIRKILNESPQVSLVKIQVDAIKSAAIRVANRNRLPTFYLSLINKEADELIQDST